MLDQLARHAAFFAAAASAQSGERLDFSPESLAILDSLLDQWLHFAAVYGGAERPDLSPYVVPAAAYVGTVLQRALRGEWVVSEEPGGRPSLVFGDAAHLDVLSLMEQILSGSVRPCLWDMYLVLERNLRERTPSGGAHSH